MRHAHFTQKDSDAVTWVFVPNGEQQLAAEAHGAENTFMFAVVSPSVPPLDSRGGDRLRAHDVVMVSPRQLSIVPFAALDMEHKHKLLLC